MLRARLAEIFARVRRRRLWRVASAVVLLPALAFVLLVVATPLPSELREPARPSLRVLARNGELLREVRADDGSRARPLPLAGFPPQVRDAVLAAEDRRFRSHFGVDVPAVLRAAFDDVLHLRVVSGASTITMQLARTVRPHPRSLWGKVREMALAVRIEASLSKDQILEEYLNRVVYGPNVRGYAAASHVYLGTSPESLSLAQAALVAGLPRGPSLYDVTKRPKLAKRRRDRILSRMADAGMIDKDAEARATSEPLVAQLERPAFGAPHLVRGLVSGDAASVQPKLRELLTAERSELEEIDTTLDPEIQRAAEGAVASTLSQLRDKHVTAAAVLVVENATGDVLAWVGSPDFYDVPSLGQNDGVLALRQPGSSLKPFVYAEAMATLGYTGATVLPDVELHIPLPGGGDYVPHDYDGKLKGPVRLREALGNSLNVPAVDTIHRLGTARVLDRLHAFGFASLTEDAEHYGPALALGDGEVTLAELANAYAALARGGERRPLRIVTRLVRGTSGTEILLEPAPAARVLDARSTAILTDILADKNARMSAFGDQNTLELEHDVAAKTGTSKGYRDNVAVGYTREVTVAVWVGNFDGSPMADVSGITGAGPIFHDVMVAAAAARPPRGALAIGRSGNAEQLGLDHVAVCALSGDVATSACPHKVLEWLPAGAGDHAPPCSVHELVRLDARNGLRAGPACERGVTTVRVFERWAPPFADWASRAGRPTPPVESSPACPAPDVLYGPDTTSDETSADDLRVTYPFDGERFILDPERPTSLQLLDVRVEPSDRDVMISVDGAPLPADRRWPLAAGTHTITAQRGGRASRPVRITVH
jgi:penicillin-binding protein 1C